MKSTANSFVLFPLGKKRFAMPADRVTELARPDVLHSFPQTTGLLAGVLLRRGRIVPVCDVAQVLVGPSAPSRRFYLIATRCFEGVVESTAIPVSGECELVRTGMIPPTGKLPDYVCGLLPLDKEIIEVLDLDLLAAGEVTP